MPGKAGVDRGELAAKEKARWEAAVATITSNNMVGVPCGREHNPRVPPHMNAVNHDGRERVSLGGISPRLISRIFHRRFVGGELQLCRKGQK